MNMLVILISICGVLQCDPHLRAGGRVLPRAPGGVGGSCREVPLASSPSQPRPRQQGEVSGILEARATIHCDIRRTVVLSKSRLKGQGTFGMDDSHAADNNDSKLHIIEASKGFQHVTDHQLDLLHINCEGCEYELLENIIENNLHRKIK